MSFWKTWVGKAIHHTTGLGKGHSDGGGGGGYRPPSSSIDSIPQECYTDLNFFSTHHKECTITFDPGTPVVTVPTDPVIIPPGPVSSVPEPSSLTLVLVGVVFLWMIHRRVR